MLKTGWNSLSECIVKLFNHMLSTETVPVKWATGYVVPLHKGGSIAHANNYRDVSGTILLENCSEQQVISRN